MKAATLAVGTTELTTNNGVLQPEIGQIEGWNPYFEMFSQPSLKDVPEVLLWKEYNFDLASSTMPSTVHESVPEAAIPVRSSNHSS